MGNSTVFDLDRLIESPDLAAFLILQLDQLASLAREVDPHDPNGPPPIVDDEHEAK
jgi:hypothetical protein